jgi:hypothetical protein
LPFQINAYALIFCLLLAFAFVQFRWYLLAECVAYLAVNW